MKVKINPSSSTHFEMKPINNNDLESQTSYFERRTLPLEIRVGPFDFMVYGFEEELERALQEEIEKTVAELYKNKHEK
jgi:hypothetical protein